jgi:FkbM family methyltransferase
VKLFFRYLFKDHYYNLSTKTAREFLKLLFLYGDKPRNKKQNISYLGFNSIVPDTLSFIWQFKEIFVDESYRFTTDSPNPVIFDCGANIGISCLFFDKNYPSAKIVAFEADPIIANILISNLDKNKVRNVEVINKAVWINDDSIGLSVDGADGATIFSDKNLVKVKSTRLKDYLEKEIKVDMLKMDIEGAEYEVILDCRNSLSCVSNIFIEYHSIVGNKQKLSEVLKVLEDNGFRYFIKPTNDRVKPFINRVNKNNPFMDLQLNIYGYK